VRLVDDQTMPPSPHAYSVEDTATLCAVSRATIDRAMTDRKLVGTWITPSKKVVRPKHIEEWLDSLPTTLAA
jgi:hypothetical protein